MTKETVFAHGPNGFCLHCGRTRAVHVSVGTSFYCEAPTSKQISPARAGLALRLQEWSRNCLIDGFHMHKGEPTLKALLREAVKILLRQEPDETTARLASDIRCRHAKYLTEPCVGCEQLSTEGGERIICLGEDGVLTRLTMRPVEPEAHICWACQATYMGPRAADGRGPCCRPVEKASADVCKRCNGRKFVVSTGQIGVPCPECRSETVSDKPCQCKEARTACKKSSLYPGFYCVNNSNTLNRLGDV